MLEFHLTRVQGQSVMRRVLRVDHQTPHCTLILQCGFSKSSANVIWFGNKPVFQKKRKSCIKQLKQVSGVGIGCQDSLSVLQRSYVYVASRRGNLSILALSGAEQGCAEDALAQCSRTGFCDHCQS